MADALCLDANALYEYGSYGLVRRWKIKKGQLFRRLTTDLRVGGQQSYIYCRTKYLYGDVNGYWITVALHGHDLIFSVYARNSITKYSILWLFRLTQAARNSRKSS